MQHCSYSTVLYLPYFCYCTLLGKSETYKETIKGTFHHYPYGTVPYLSCHYYGTNNPYSYRELIITCLVAPEGWGWIWGLADLGSGITD